MMSLFSTSLLAFLISCFSLFQPRYSFEIAEVTEDNYNDLLKSEFLVLYFHATWASNSLKHKREYQTLVKILETNASVKDKNINFGIVSSKSVRICKEYEVKNYPTIVFIKDGYKYYYHEKLSADFLADWIEGKILSQMTRLYNMTDLKNQVDQFESVVIFYNEEGESSPDFKIFRNASMGFQDLPFFYTSNATIPELISLKTAQNSSNIFIIKNYDEGLSSYKENEIEHSRVVEFISSYAYPLMKTFNNDNFIKAVNTRLSFTILFMTNTNDNSTTDLKDNYYKALEEVRGMYNMFGNFSEQSQTTLSIDFEIGKKTLPVILLQEFSKCPYTENIIIKRYRSEKEDLRDYDSIRSFFLRYKNNTLERFLKSDKLPKNLVTNNVYQLVGKNFEEIVTDENKNVVVLFTRRACGLCVEFEKKFTNVAIRLQKRSDLLFGKIDGLNNDIVNIVNLGYPSLVLFKKGKNKFTNYLRYENSAFEEGDITDFINTSLIEENNLTSENMKSEANQDNQQRQRTGRDLEEKPEL